MRYVAGRRHSNHKFSVLFVALGFIFFNALTVQAATAPYVFASSSDTYMEITGGTVHGSTSNDDVSFNAVNIGFTFTYDGVDYTQVGIQSNGFIAMGSMVYSSYTPISTGSSNNVIVALGRDLQGNGTTSELMSLTEGIAPNRVFTVQWKDYKRYGSSYEGDAFDFQIKLYETSNRIEVVYGQFTPVYNASPPTVQVGLRGASNADFNNRMTDATHDWSDSLAGIANNSVMALTDTIHPATGLTYEWIYEGGSCEWIPESAWSDGERYVQKGNWATYTTWGPGAEATLYAGQSMEAGIVEFSAVDDGDVTITITLNEGWRFADVEENVKIEGYASPPTRKPNPGKFTWKDEAATSPFSIVVDAAGYYGVHVDVEWADCSAPE